MFQSKVLLYEYVYFCTSFVQVWWYDSKQFPISQFGITSIGSRVLSHDAVAQQTAKSIKKVSKHESFE